LSSFFIGLVEDDQSVLEALESLLEYAGYEVLLYSAAEDFLVSGRLHDVHCLITDIGLPGISGIELLRLVRARNPGLPTLVITARGEAAVLQAATAAGAREVFLKPLDNAQLLAAIEECRALRTS
jgi:FixJ family two-component response regulator